MFDWLPTKNEFRVMFIVIWIIAAFSGIGCWNCCKYVYNNVHVTIGNK